MLLATLIVAAAMTQTTPPPTPKPADEWRPYAANPKYEVYGHDEAGVFRFRFSRPAVAPKKVVNYGVNLAPRATIGAPVSGTDLDAGRELAEATHRAAGAEAARPCPDDRVCPSPPPSPGPSIPHPLRDIATLPVIGWTIAALVVAGVAVLGFGLLALILVVWLRK